uniref:GDSL esterase/lipase n=1 Tax=Leersia perrieri TaxID=77586 RepID=A0A0D9X2P4_9ORYZ
MAGNAAAMAFIAVVCAAAMAAVSGAEEVYEFGSGASFIFGDSLVDAGNNNFIPSLSKANMTPNGIDFAASGGMPTGRFTNGRTIADIIGEMLGQTDYSPPFLAPNTTGGALLNGVNYASGGAGILNGTGRIFVNRIGMDLQVDYFNITRKQLDDLLGKAKAKEFLKKNAIFSVTVGSNDFLNNYLMPVLSAGTRKTINRVGENECVKLPNQLASKYNGRLRELLIQLNSELPGFETASMACCGNGGSYDGMVPCGPASSMCSNRKSHVFWDPYHPSEAANLVMAKYIVDGDSKYISPMNLRKLLSL